MITMKRTRANWNEKRYAETDRGDGEKVRRQTEDPDGNHPDQQGGLADGEELRKVTLLH